MCKSLTRGAAYLFCAASVFTISAMTSSNIIEAVMEAAAEATGTGTIQKLCDWLWQKLNR